VAEDAVYVSINDVGPMVATVTSSEDCEEIDWSAPLRTYGVKMWRAEVPHCPDRQFRRLHTLAPDAERPVEVRFFGPAPDAPVHVGRAWMTVGSLHDMGASQACWALDLRSIGSLRPDD
jgi:hypothetical protein